MCVFVIVSYKPNILCIWLWFNVFRNKLPTDFIETQSPAPDYWVSKLRILKFILISVYGNESIFVVSAKNVHPLPNWREKL